MRRNNNKKYIKNKNKYILIYLNYDYKIKDYNCIKIINTNKIK